ncbi:MAG: RNA polymerase sigma factor [Prevotella sp.]|nr:sigma-70 family RNA polymerase sigma factor [Prevotella sp.]MDD6862343.1 sigma-70 family RNA polymerase sigma factor [Prevotella sp.]MDD7226581.1 sigma-70 family RNA polymerase sigma factor [Prevotella sp.]MDY4499466.1 sigma-70 family RNA polymerase sigma factor [Prevotella sp.]
MNIFGQHSEEDIAKGIRKGDNRAMRHFYAQYGGLLAAACSRYVNNDDDVKDLMQDAMVNIIQNIDNFTYKGKGSLRAWATRIVVNQALNFVKSQKRFHDTFADKDLGNLSLADNEEPDISDVPAEVIHRLISQLPDGYRTVFNLFAIEGKSHKEIAALLGIKADTSASQFFRAKNILAKQIENYKRNKNHN